MLCVWKMEREQCVIKHVVERHFPYVVYVLKIEGVVHGILIEHCTERHLPYVVCAENGCCCA